MEEKNEFRAKSSNDMNNNIIPNSDPFWIRMREEDIDSQTNLRNQFKGPLENSSLNPQKQAFEKSKLGNITKKNSKSPKKKYNDKSTLKTLSSKDNKSLKENVSGNISTRNLEAASSRSIILSPLGIGKPFEILYHQESEINNTNQTNVIKNKIKKKKLIKNYSNDFSDFDTDSTANSEETEDNLLFTLNLMKEKRNQEDEEIIQKSNESNKVLDPQKNKVNLAHSKFVNQFMKLKKQDSVSILPTFYLDRAEIKEELKKDDEKDLGIKFYLEGEDGMTGFKNALEFRYHHQQIRRIQKSVQFSSAPKPLDFAMFRKDDLNILNSKKDNNGLKMDSYRKKMLLNRIGEIGIKYAGKVTERFDYLKKNEFPKYEDPRCESRLTERNRGLLYRIKFVESSLSQYNPNSHPEKKMKQIIGGKFTSPYVSSPTKLMSQNETPFQKYTHEASIMKEKISVLSEWNRTKNAISTRSISSNPQTEKNIQYVNYSAPISILPRLTLSRFSNINIPNPDYYSSLEESIFNTSVYNTQFIDNEGKILQNANNEKNIQHKSFKNNDTDFFITQHSGTQFFEDSFNNEMVDLQSNIQNTNKVEDQNINIKNSKLEIINENQKLGQWVL